MSSSSLISSVCWKVEESAVKNLKYSDYFVNYTIMTKRCERDDGDANARGPL